MVKTKTLTQRVADLEKENRKILKRLKKVERELREDDVQLPPDLTPEEREQQEALDKWHRIGVWE